MQKDGEPRGGSFHTSWCKDNNNSTKEFFTDLLYIFLQRCTSLTWMKSCCICRKTKQKIIIEPKQSQTIHSIHNRCDVVSMKNYTEWLKERSKHRNASASRFECWMSDWLVEMHQRVWSSVECRMCGWSGGWLIESVEQGTMCKWGCGDLGSVKANEW